MSSTEIYEHGDTRFYETDLDSIDVTAVLSSINVSMHSGCVFYSVLFKPTDDKLLRFKRKCNFSESIERRGKSVEQQKRELHEVKNGIIKYSKSDSFMDSEVEKQKERIRNRILDSNELFRHSWERVLATKDSYSISEDEKEFKELDKIKSKKQHLVKKIKELREELRGLNDEENELYNSIAVDSLQNDEIKEKLPAELVGYFTEKAKENELVKESKSFFNRV